MASHNDTHHNSAKNTLDYINSFNFKAHLFLGGFRKLDGLWSYNYVVSKNDNDNFVKCKYTTNKYVDENNNARTKIIFECKNNYDEKFGCTFDKHYDYYDNKGYTSTCFTSKIDIHEPHKYVHNYVSVDDFRNAFNDFVNHSMENNWHQSYC